MIHFLWQQLDIVFWLKILARSDRRLSELVLVALFALCTFWLCELPGVQRHSQHQRPRQQRVGVRTCELRGLQGACKRLCHYCNGSGPAPVTLAIHPKSNYWFNVDLKVTSWKWGNEIRSTVMDGESWSAEAILFVDSAVSTGRGVGSLEKLDWSLHSALALVKEFWAAINCEKLRWHSSAHCMLEIPEIICTVIQLYSVQFWQGHKVWSHRTSDKTRGFDCKKTLKLYSWHEIVRRPFRFQSEKPGVESSWAVKICTGWRGLEKHSSSIISKNLRKSLDVVELPVLVMIKWSSWWYSCHVSDCFW